MRHAQLLTDAPRLGPKEVAIHTRSNKWLPGRKADRSSYLVKYICTLTCDLDGSCSQYVGGGACVSAAVGVLLWLQYAVGRRVATQGVHSLRCVWLLGALLRAHQSDRLPRGIRLRSLDHEAVLKMEAVPRDTLLVLGVPEVGVESASLPLGVVVVLLLRLRPIQADLVELRRPVAILFCEGIVPLTVV